VIKCVESGLFDSVEESAEEHDCSCPWSALESWGGGRGKEGMNLHVAFALPQEWRQQNYWC